MAANYFDTQLLGFTGRAAAKFQKPELRELQSEVLSVGLKNQSYLMDGIELDKIKETLYRPVYADSFVRTAATNGTSFTAFNTGSLGASQRTALTWVGFTETFSMYATSGQDNDLKWQAMWDDRMGQTQRNLRERLRVWLMGQIHSARTSGGNVTSIPTGLGVWNGSTNAYEISDTNNFFSYITQIMAINKYYTPDFKFDIFCDNVLYPKYQSMVNQGSGNALNTSYQFKDYENVYRDTLLGTYVAEEYNNGMAIVLPSNSFALVPFLPALFLNPKEGFTAANFNSYTGGYGTIADGAGYGMYNGDTMTEPLLYGVHGWANQADNAANNGSSQDMTMQFQVGLYMCFQSAVISNANETPIYEFGFTG
jgi:hypothetical protein